MTAFHFSVNYKFFRVVLGRKHEDLGSNPQHPCKKPATAMRTLRLNVAGADEGVLGCGGGQEDAGALPVAINLVGNQQAPSSGGDSPSQGNMTGNHRLDKALQILFSTLASVQEPILAHTNIYLCTKLKLLFRVAFQTF